MRGKKEARITLHMSELIYDIQNKTYITGRSRADGQNHALVAAMQANDDDENLNQILRSIMDAHHQLKAKLSEYMIEQTEQTCDELISPEGVINISLLMPSNYNQATVDTICAMCHQYIVNMAAFDWFTITCKPDAQDYYNKAQINLAALNEAINKRVRPMRTTPPERW